MYECAIIYEGESHNLKLHVASGDAIFTLLMRRWVAFLHGTAPVGHSSNREYHCCQLTDNRAVFRIFIAFLRFSFDSPSYILQAGVWTCLIWFRTGTGGGLL